MKNVKKVREDKTQAIIDYHLEEMGKSDKPPSFYLNFKHKIEQKDARIKELEEREKKLIEALEFYSDGLIVHGSDKRVSMGYMSDWEFIGSNLYHCGKLARQTLKELEKDKE